MEKIQKKRGALILLLFGLVLALQLTGGGCTVRAAESGIKGIDVSKWQGKIDWEKVRTDGVEFVMLGTGRLKGSEP